MITQYYYPNDYRGILVEEGDSLLEYLDNISQITKGIQEGRLIDHDREGNKYKSRLITKLDKSRRNGIVYEKIRLLIIFKMIMISKKRFDVD